ncbi:MarR family transcriptional regulator [Mucilaginibacter hurinus]|uniref:MarR family transcriptional regulator n=1 Tax=Mucilaginibacter hurinus TaxID=2201324 RepID=A0A367GJU5_9SPHI|nr:MarR family winged helix-turn-helix transcriptional regulator [Mucilaginibacter hurinus]RCH53747.1 MarR family transcriptional regulator [Mucilaginibacter hurinus]
MKFKAQKESVNYLFTQVCKLRRNQSNLLLSASGLHAGQDVLLYYLDMHDGQTITALAEKMQVQYATISNMIDRMEAAGLLNKKKDEVDKRTSRVFLTGEGRQCVGKINDAWRILEAKTLEGFTSDEKIALTGLLSRILLNLKSQSV